MATQYLWTLLASAAAVGALRLLFLVYDVVVAQPRRLRSALRHQGLSGPPPALLLGNILQMKRARDEAAKAAPVAGPPAAHNCGAALLPFFDEWRERYGEVFVFALGTTQIVHVTQPEMVKEITTCTSLDLGKPAYQAKERGALLGQGILTSNGPHWVHQRKILAPELFMDKVKGMIGLIQDSSVSLCESWTRLVGEGGGIAEIKIDEYMRSFSGDVISRACFGSNFSKGEEIFLKLRALQEVTSKKVFATGTGMRHIPTKSNREAWALEKEIKSLILNVVKERDESGFEKDLLQMVLEGARQSDLSREAVDRFVVDNCKNIYLAGYETTAVSATWCLMLLASNPEWQDRIRHEVADVFNGRLPDYKATMKMKLLTMAINESLRLYPPVSVVSREALKDMIFGKLNVPKGVNLWTLVTTLHTDPEIWGSDSYEFNPQRFAEGVAGACKYPYLYMPFGVGPRLCLGQNLALIELKILISLILSKYSISLSPKYVHSPLLNLVIEPKFGVHLLVKPL
ncbi:cytochrome P450 714C2-like protein [Salvia divinorum]|uniref:Cytochrome P450 714C2-like protein n=1 Tax=Salvia divinorum TaxID=28513 RepID=A0ABD1GSZ2_SALDI